MLRNLWEDMEEASIAFLRECAPPDGSPYYGAFSGGKDSVVILDLVQRAGVPVDWHYNITCVDPPELVHFIKRQHPDVKREPPATSMWRLVEKNGLPTRVARFCCVMLKEKSGHGRRVITGIRAQESPARRTRGPIEQSRSDPTKTFVHPILSWTSHDVWSYIRERKLPYCRLYDEGFKRLGCVVCPFQRTVAASMARWPKLWAAMRRATQRYWDNTATATVKDRFANAEAFWQWWLARDMPYPKKTRDCAGLFV